MAKFKNNNLLLKSNQKILLGDNQDSEIKFNGSNLLIRTSSGLEIDGSIYFDSTGVHINNFSDDSTLSEKSSTTLPTERAVKTYVESISGQIIKPLTFNEYGTGASQGLFGITGGKLDLHKMFMGFPNIGTTWWAMKSASSGSILGLGISSINLLLMTRVSTKTGQPIYNGQTLMSSTRWWEMGNIDPEPGTADVCVLNNHTSAIVFKRLDKSTQFQTLGTLSFVDILSPVEIYNSSEDRYGHKLLALHTENIVVITHDSSSNLMFKIMTPGGQELISDTIISTDVVDILNEPTILSNGSWAISYRDSSDNIKFSIYDYNGTSIVSEVDTTIDSHFVPSIVGLSGGVLIVSGLDYNSNEVVYVKYNNQGTFFYKKLMYNEISFSDVSAVSEKALAALPDGGFVFSYTHKEDNISQSHLVCLTSELNIHPMMDGQKVARGQSYSGLLSGNYIESRGPIVTNDGAIVLPESVFDSSSYSLTRVSSFQPSGPKGENYVFDDDSFIDSRYNAYSAHPILVPQEILNNSVRMLDGSNKITSRETLQKKFFDNFISSSANWPPSMAVLRNGHVVLAWQEDSTSSNIVFQIFNSDGTAVTSIIPIESGYMGTGYISNGTRGTGIGACTALPTGDQGDFVIAYVTSDFLTSKFAIVKSDASNWNPTYDDITITIYTVQEHETPNHLSVATVGSLPNGNFVFGNNLSIYDADGNCVYENEDPTSKSEFPTIVRALPSGSFATAKMAEDEFEVYPPIPQNRKSLIKNLYPDPNEGETEWFIVLPNGRLVFKGTEDSWGITLNYYITIREQTGVDVKTIPLGHRFLRSAGTYLPNGNFVVIGIDKSDTNLYYEIYTPDGDVVYTSPSLGTYGDIFLNAETLPNGDVIFVYRDTATHNFYICSLEGTGTKINGYLELNSGVSVNEISSDTTLGDNSNTAIPTERAVKTYVDSLVGGETYSGKVQLSQDTTSIVVIYSESQPDSQYSIITNIINTVDVSPSIYGHIMIDYDKNGFTEIFSAPIDSPNYELHFILSRNKIESSSSSSSRSSSSSSSSSHSSSSSNSSSGGSGLPAWLSGFPEGTDEHIQVVIGSGWGSAPFSEDDTIVLTQVSGTTKWSENGTDVYDATDNTLMLEWDFVGSPTSSGSVTVKIWVPYPFTTSASVWSLANHTKQGTWSSGNPYPFKSFWSNNIAFPNANGKFFTTSSVSFQDMFKSFTFISD